MMMLVVLELGKAVWDVLWGDNYPLAWFVWSWTLRS